MKSDRTIKKQIKPVSLRITYLLARPESRIHSFSPNLAVFHHGCQLPCCGCASVPLQLVDKCCPWTPSSPLPMGGFPENQAMDSKFRVSLAVSRQSRSLLASILSLSLGSFPYNFSFVILSLQLTLKTFRRILVISTIQRCLHCTCKRPCFTSIQQDGLDCGDKEFSFQLYTHYSWQISIYVSCY